MPEPVEEPRPTAQQKRSESTTQQLLAAAVTLISERGYERTTTAEICSRAGYSNAMVHLRFGSKDGLVTALLRSCEYRLFESDVDPSAPGLDRLLGKLLAVRRAARTEPRLLRAFFTIQFELSVALPPLRNWLIAWLDDYAEHAEQTIRQGQTDGSIRPELVPALEARSVLNNMIGCGFRWVANPAVVDIDADLAQWQVAVSDRLAPRSAPLAAEAIPTIAEIDALTEKLACRLTELYEHARAEHGPTPPR